MVTKTYLKPTFLPINMTVVTVVTVLDSSDSSESSDSSDSSDQKNSYFSHKTPFSNTKKLITNFFHQKTIHKKTVFHTKKLHQKNQ